MKVATIALRDNILAVLRDAEGFPMPTAEIAAKVGGHRTYRRKTHSNCPGCPCVNERHYPIRAEDVRPHLQALAKRGLVERIKVPGYRSVYWRASAACA